METMVIGASIGWLVLGMLVTPRMAWGIGVILIGAGAMAVTIGWWWAGGEARWPELLRGVGTIVLSAGLLWAGAGLASWSVNRRSR